MTHTHKEREKCAEAKQEKSNFFLHFVFVLINDFFSHKFNAFLVPTLVKEEETNKRRRRERRRRESIENTGRLTGVHFFQSSPLERQGRQKRSTR